MEAKPSTADKPAGTPSGPGADKAGDRKHRPIRVLPTPRIAFAKQLELLRAYAAVSATTGRAVKISDVAPIVKLTPSTVSLANPFFVDANFLHKQDGGFAPSGEVGNFSNAFDWQPESAGQNLAPALERTWFAQTLLPTLAVRPMREADAVANLAQAASAPKEYRPQLRLLLDYLEVARLIHRDGDQIRASRGDPSRTVTTHDRDATAVANVARLSSQAQTSSVPPPIAGGVVQFQVSVRVDMAELANWNPDRIAAFFSGIAQVLAAKGSLERDGGERLEK